MRERNRLEAAITTVVEAEQEYSDSLEIIELAEMEDDAEMVEEAVTGLNALAERMRRAQLETLLSGEADGNDAFVEIHSGAGGTESQDWAAMLARMYSRWANAHGYKVETMEEQAGEEAGLKSTTILVKGENAYGWLKTEAGVHRLVRISPFDSSARRHTSFSSVGVYPQIDDAIDVDIDVSKVRTDTYRASGAGGQHINKTDSAVRITHLPTGIVVQCQNERSQHKNRGIALKMLAAKLFELRESERDDELKSMYGNKGEIAWGSQIRSYVLHPYQMVKDHRTNFEIGNTQSVLDGNIDPFIEEYLRSRASR